MVRTGSPLKNMSFCLTKKLSVGHPPSATLSGLFALPLSRISALSNDRIDAPPPPRVFPVAMAVRIDNPADRLVADRSDRGNEIRGRFGSHRIHDQHALIADAHSTVAA